MDFENSDYDSVSVEFDFRGDAVPTAMDPYRDDVISDHQQSILNELRINLCQEDLIYINNHKEVEAIASLLYNEILKKSPKNPYEFAAGYLKNPQTADQVANFKPSVDFKYENILKKNNQQYATAAAAVKIATSELNLTTLVTSLDEQTEESEDGETEMVADLYNLLVGDGEISYIAEEEAELTFSQKE